MEINGTLEYTKFHLSEKWELHYYADITIETHPKKKNNWILRFAFDNEIAHTCVYLAVRNVRWTFVKHGPKRRHAHGSLPRRTAAG